MIVLNDLNFHRRKEVQETGTAYHSPLQIIYLYWSCVYQLNG